MLVVLVFQIGLGWAQPPKYGGTLRIALSGEPAFFNANQGPAPGAPAFFISNSIYNSLLTLTPPPALDIVADVQRRLADQLEWVNVTTYPFFQAYRTATVKNFPFYNHAFLFLDTTWLEK
jgi:hypothetical protein